MKTNSDDPISGSAPVAFQISEKDNDKLLPIYGPGLTKREYFAAMAMQGMVNIYFDDENRAQAHEIDLVGKFSIQYADALINALNGEGEK